MFAPRTLSKPPLSLSVLPYGLTLDSLTVSLDADHTRDLLVGYADLKDHAFDGPARGRAFMNQTVGRYANRLPAKSTFGRGVELSLPPGKGGVCLHGGPRGLDTQEWTAVSRASSALFPSADAAFPEVAGSEGKEAIYRVVSEAGSNGFPLTLEIEGLVVVKDHKVLVVLRAKIVDDGAKGIAEGTPVNLTVHWGWNLGSFNGVESDTILKHKLWIDSSAVTETDSDRLSTGKVLSTASGTALETINYSQGVASDPSSHRTVGSTLPSAGIDRNMIFNKRTDASLPKVVLTSPDAKVSLAFRTNQSTVQAYTGQNFDAKHSRKALHKNGDKGYPSFGAMFLEFMQPMGTFLHPELAEIAGTDTVLREGEVYESWVEVAATLRQ